MSTDEFNALDIGFKVKNIYSLKEYKIAHRRNKDKWLINGGFFISNHNKHEYELVK